MTAPVLLRHVSAGEWRLFAELYGPAAAAIMYRSYLRNQHRARRHLRVRLVLTAAAYIFLAILAMLGAYGIVLAAIAVFGYVAG